MTTAAAGRFKGHPWGIIAVLSLAYFMSQLDSLVLTLALPAVARDFDAPMDTLVWAMSAYVLVLAVSLITAGRLGDLYGRRRMFLTGLALFSAGSLAAGLSGGPGQLIAARAVQGLGAALLTPQTLALIVDHIPAERRGTALGVRGAVGGLAAAAGPVIGGLLVGTLGWRWVFFINLPVGAVCFALAWLVLPGGGGTPGGRIDRAGVVLATLSLAGLTFAVNQGPAYHWDLRVWAVLAAAVALAAGFLGQQRTVQEREPLVPFALFRDRAYAWMNGFSVTVTLTVSGLVLVLSVFLQSVAGYSPVKAGLVLLPASLCSMAFDPLAGRLTNRIQGRYLLLGGAAVSVAGMLWTTVQMRESAQWPVFVAPMCVVGIGNAFLFTPLAAVALRGVRPAVAGAASGVLVTSLQIGSMAGTAVAGALLGSAASPSAGDVRTAMVVLAAIGVVAALTCLPARSPAEPPPDPEPAPAPAGMTAGGSAEGGAG